MRTISLVYLLKPAIALASPYIIYGHDTKEPKSEPGSEEFWFHIIVSGFLVVIGGVFAGYANLYQPAYECDYDANAYVLCGLG
jgi:hypothetical protein